MDFHCEITSEKNALGLYLDGRVSAVVGSYNAGPQAVARWLAEAPEGQPDDVLVEGMPYTQRRSYARRVLRSYWL